MKKKIFSILMLLGIAMQCPTTSTYIMVLIAIVYIITDSIFNSVPSIIYIMVLIAIMYIITIT